MPIHRALLAAGDFSSDRDLMADTSGSSPDLHAFWWLRFAVLPEGHSSEAFDPGHPPMSVQALQLHVRCVAAAATAGTAGLIGRAAAAEIAENSSALMEELVEAGFWRETDLSYEVVHLLKPVARPLV